jgi:enterochelin esterase-like enzyme
VNPPSFKCLLWSVIALGSLTVACSDAVSSPDVAGGSGASTGGTGTTAGAGQVAGTAGAGGNAGTAGAVGTSGSSNVAGGGAGTGGVSGAAGSGGAAAGNGGAGGSAGSGGSGLTRPKVEVASSVPGEYGQPVASPGKVEKLTYPVYFYTTESGGSNTMTTTPRKDQPITKPCTVYTPPGYDANTTYPLIFVLHGITDSPETWFERGSPKPNVLLDNLITSKKIEPVVAVFPHGNSHDEYATQTSYSDTAGYYLFGNELMNDLIPFIEAKYSLKKERGWRAVAGFSMGGMQTINIGLSQHLKDFAWFGALSPAPSSFNATQIASYVQTQNEPTAYPLGHFYAVVGESDGTAGGAYSSSTNGLATKGQFITTMNLTAHKVPGAHVYPVATIGLYNFLRIAFGI